MKQLIKKILIPTLLIISIGRGVSIACEHPGQQLIHLLEALQKKCVLPTQQKIEDHDAIDSEVILDYIQECITYIEKHADDFSSNEIEDILFEIEKYCTSPSTQHHYRNSDKTKTYGSLLVKRKLLAGCLAIRGNACINGKTFLNDNLTIAGNIIPDANNTFSLGNSSHTWNNIFAQDGVFNGTLTVANLDLSGSLIFDNLSITNDLTVGNAVTIGNGLTVSAGGANITGDITENGNILPNGLHDLGSLVAPWDNVYANDGNFAGTLTAANFVLTNDITVNNATINNDLTVGNAATIGNGLTVSAGGADIAGNISAAGDILPDANNTRDLGSNLLQWDNVYASNGNFSGTLTAANFVLTNDITVNNATINNDLTVGNTATIGNGLTVSAGGANITGDITENGNILPNGLHDLGSLVAPWDNVYANDGNFAGTLTAANFVLTNDITVNNATINNDLSVGNDATIGNNLTVDTDVLVVDATNNRVGVNTATPTAALDVVGATNISTTATIGTGLTVSAGGATITGDITEGGNILPDANNARNLGSSLLRWANVFGVNGDFTGTLTAGSINIPTAQFDTLTVGNGSDPATLNFNSSGASLTDVQLIATGGTASAGQGNLAINAANTNISTNLTVDTNVLVVDATNNRVGINNATPLFPLDVTGAANITSNLSVDTNVLFVNAATNRVGINNAAPTVALDVTGATNISTTATIGTGLTVSAGGANITGNINQTGNILSTANLLFDLGSPAGRWANVFAGDGDFSGTLTVDTLNITNDITVNNATINNDLTVGNDASIGNNLAVDTDTLFVDATNDRVGINTAAPTVALDVVGAANISTTATIGTGLTVTTGGASITGTINQTGNILSTANLLFDLGSPAGRWANVFAGDGDFSGTLTAASINIPTAQFDTLTVGNGSDPATLNFNSSGASLTDVQLIATGGTASAGQGNLAINAANTNISTNLTVDTNVLVVDATNNRVGINNATPTVALDVTGATNISTTATIGTGLTVSAGGANITGNITETGNILPDANNTRDIGSGALRWANIFGVTANFSGAATVGNGLTVSAGGANITGNIIEAGNILPDANNTRDLGASGNRWATIYGVNGNFTGTLTAASINIPTAQFDTLTVGNGSDPATLNFNSSGASLTDVQLIATGGTASAGQGNLAINAANTNVSTNFTVDTDVLVVNASTNRVGINVASPTEALDVSGNINFPTTTSLTGQIKQNGTRLINTFGTNNIFFGPNAGNFSLSGTNNSGFGANSFLNLTSGGDNTAFGNLAGGNIGSGGFNTAIGSAAGRNLNTGSFNTLIGLQAGNTLMGGDSNTFVGESVGYNTTTAASNSGFGAQSLINLVDGTFNTSVGNSSGGGIISGTNNTFLGRNAGASGDFSNATAIGANASVGASNALVLGDAANVGIGTSTPAVKLDVVGAASISGNLAVDTNTLFVDATNNRVGINNAAPAVALDVTGAANITSNLTVDTNTLVVDATNNRVGVNITSPQQALDVVGNVQYQPTGSSAPAFRPISSQNSFLLRVVRGTVSTPAAGAAIIQGEGFSVASTGSAGVVDITFSQAFSAAPTIVCTSNNIGSSYVVSAGNITTTTFRMAVNLSTTGALTAVNSSFIAIGT